MVGCGCCGGLGLHPSFSLRHLSSTAKDNTSSTRECLLREKEKGTHQMGREMGMNGSNWW